jgi:hypothetical protein
LHSRMFKFFQDMRRKAKSAYYSLSGECPF